MTTETQAAQRYWEDVADGEELRALRTLLVSRGYSPGLALP